MQDPIEALNKLSALEGGPKTKLVRVPVAPVIDFGVALDQYMAYTQKEFECGWCDAESGNPPCQVSEAYNAGYYQSYACQACHEGQTEGYPND
jgi:hypothetical protein